MSNLYNGLINSRLERKSNYNKLVEPIIEFFGKENVYLILAEELKENPQIVMDSVFSFLGLCKIPIKPLTKVHAGCSPRFFWITKIIKWATEQQRTNSYIKYKLFRILSLGLKGLNRKQGYKKPTRYITNLLRIQYDHIVEWAKQYFGTDIYYYWWKPK